MSAVLFSCHNDDETLFAFYQALRYKPKVIVVLRSFKEAGMGGPTYAVREAETDCAMKVAGVPWEQWVFSDLDPDWRGIANAIDRTAVHFDLIIAPAYEDGGHEQHNEVARISRRWHRISYLSYRRGHSRSEGTEVIPTPEEAALKREALACYASQAAFPPTAPWFGSDQREFVL